MKESRMRKILSVVIAVVIWTTMVAATMLLSACSDNPAPPVSDETSSGSENGESAESGSSDGTQEGSATQDDATHAESGQETSTENHDSGPQEDSTQETSTEADTWAFEAIPLPEIPQSPVVVDHQCTFLKDTGADTYYRIDLTYADGSQRTFIDPAINLPDDQKEARMAYQVKTINELADANRDVNFYVFIPTSFEFSPIFEEYIPRASNYPYIERFLEGLDPRIKADSLVFHTLDERLYINYRSDLHWCDDGIYVGYCKLYNMMYEDTQSPPPPACTVRERITLDTCKFYGRHSRKMGITDIYDVFSVNDYGLPPHTTVPSITFAERVEKIRVNEDASRNIYGEYFPQLDHVAYPDNHTGRNLMIIGDSFTQSIVELLASAFDNTYAFYISDYRGLAYNEFIEQNNITDVLVMQDAYRLVVNSDNDSHLDKVLLAPGE